MAIPLACRAEPPSVPIAQAKTMKVQSTAFAEGAAIPKLYTCDGRDITPPLAWSEPPPGSKQLALVCDDPDAPVGVFTHWVLYGLPATTRSLPENLPKDALVKNPAGAQQGTNDFNRVGYGGPCPPKGKPHRYRFTVYALGTELKLPPRATKADLLKAMTGQILDQGTLTGTYRR